MIRPGQSILLLLLLTAVARSQSTTESNWHQWRGPYANGQAAANAQPPIRWDAHTHIRWTADLRGEGSATPIIWNDQIFVLSAEATDRKAEQPPIADASAKTIPPDVYYRFWVTSLDRHG